MARFRLGGRGSVDAPNAARCAGDQGESWDMHDQPQVRQPSKPNTGALTTKLKSLGAGLGLDTAAFNACGDGARQPRRSPTPR
jgi:protein-disulfide isomerase